MSKLKDAIETWEKENEGKKCSEEEKLKLIGKNPPIEKMDSASLSNLKNCKSLSLSSNNIERIGNMTGMKKLETLSLSRNLIKKLENLDTVSSTLKNLWLSNNVIEKLTGIDKLKKLKVLYMANNKVEKWTEFDKLKDLPELENLLFKGNPIQEDVGDEEKWRLTVLKRLPHLKVLDGQPVLDEEIEKAKKFS